MPVPFKPSKRQPKDDQKNVKPCEVKHLEESNDNKAYPPIKEAKDPFLKWF